MRRSYKFVLRPTTRQEHALANMLADHCTLYNAALQERRDAYRHPSRTSVRYGGQSAQLRNSSRTCPDCGYVAAENRVSQATFRCVRCRFTAHADVVGATNIAYRAGLVRHDAA